MKYPTVEDFEAAVKADQIEGLVAYSQPAGDGPGGFYVGPEWTDYVQGLYDEKIRDREFCGSIQDFQRHILEGAGVDNETVRRFLHRWGNDPMEDDNMRLEHLTEGVFST